jgi:RNA-directed DNA polymerase
VTDLPPHLYVQHGVEQGRNADVVARASAHRATQLASGVVVPILSLGHLAHLTGASYSYLREIVERKRDPYIDITRPKRDGGSRALSSPEPPLMEIQRWILRNVLYLARPHPSSYAYQAKRSIVHCARTHLGARWLVKMDLHDFFGTIDETRVYSAFNGLGYSPLVSLELTRICTRLTRSHAAHRIRSRAYQSVPSYATDDQGWLPQGAPTSGALANAAAHALDRKLSQIASRRALTYTRYSDDLIFSAGATFNRGLGASLIDHVRNVVRDEHLVLHDKKTRVVPPGARHVVLGLMLGRDRVQLLPEFKRRIDVHIRGVDRFGLAQHAAHRGFRSIFSFVNHVDGCLAFAHGVEPEHARQGRERWNAALDKSGFPVEAS